MGLFGACALAVGSPVSGALDDREEVVHLHGLFGDERVVAEDVSGGIDGPGEFKTEVVPRGLGVGVAIARVGALEPHAHPHRARLHKRHLLGRVGIPRGAPLSLGRGLDPEKPVLVGDGCQVVLLLRVVLQVEPRVTEALPQREVGLERARHHHADGLGPPVSP